MKFFKGIFLFGLFVALISCHKDSVKPEVKESWDRVLLDNGRDSTAQIEDIYFSSASVGYILGGLTNHWPAKTILFKTIDGGNSWQKDSINIDSYVANKILGQYNNAIHISGYTLGSSVTDKFKSEDGGTTWQSDTTSADYFLDADNQLRYRHGIQRTNDGGITWKTVYSGIYHLSPTFVQFTSKMVGYACGGNFDYSDTPPYLPGEYNGFIIKTNDGGKSWEDLGVKYVNLSFMSFVDDQTGFYSTPEYVLYKTTDGGRSWQEMSRSIILNFGTSAMIDGLEGYSSHHLSGRILHTVDGGKTWKEVHNESVNIKKLYLTPDKNVFAIYTINSDQFLLKLTR